MKTTTAERDPAAAAKLRELIQNIAVAMVTTVTPDGALHSRPMLTVDNREEGELWFFTSDESRTAEDVAEEQAVNASYADPEHDRYVSVSGQATLVSDRDRLEELWASPLARFFPNGLKDPHLGLLRVRIESAEYWDAGTSRMQPLRSEPQPHDGTPRGARGGRRSEQNASDAERATGEHTKVEIRATPTTG